MNYENATTLGQKFTAFEILQDVSFKNIFSMISDCMRQPKDLRIIIENDDPDFYYMLDFSNGTEASPLWYFEDNVVCIISHSEFSEHETDALGNYYNLIEVARAIRTICKRGGISTIYTETY